MKYVISLSIFVVAILFAACVSPAYAQAVGGGKKGVFAKHQPFAESPQEAFEEAKQRQCPVVLCIMAAG